MPDRAGVKIPLLNIVKFIIKAITTSIIPRMIASRPSVVDARVYEVGDPSPCAFALVCEPYFMQFIKKIKSEKGYERIGAVG